MTRFFHQVKAAGAMAAALTAIVAAYAQFGPMPAWSEDIRRLDRQQTEIAVDIYRQAVKDGVLLQTFAGNNATARAIIEEDLREARENLKRARDRQIELAR
jgi:hypothetical protein